MSHFEPDLDAALDGVGERFLPRRVPVGPLQAALRGPAAVAVHHDRDVRGNVVGIDVGQEAAHGADLASMGSDRIRRSRWYSANP